MNEYKITELTRVGEETVATCVLDGATIKATVTLSKEATEALWNYCTGGWEKDVLASVEDGKVTMVHLCSRQLPEIDLESL